MTEPTDYHAEAEAWLRSAAAGETQPQSIEFALIGIGYALLALGDAHAQPATTINLSGNATREQIRDVLERHGKAD